MKNISPLQGEEVDGIYLFPGRRPGLIYFPLSGELQAHPK